MRQFLLILFTLACSIAKAQTDTSASRVIFFDDFNNNKNNWTVADNKRASARVGAMLAASLLNTVLRGNPGCSNPSPNSNENFIHPWQFPGYNKFITVKSSRNIYPRKVP